MMTDQLRLCELSLSPCEVAAGLRHLGGLVFFDSSGNFPDSAGEIISVVAARPVDELRGNIADPQQMTRLEDALGGGLGPMASRGDGGALGPAGGLCGWIGYEGDFCFGVYPEMLVYRHSSGQWYEVGGLSKEVMAGVAEVEKLEVGEFLPEMEASEYCAKVDRIKEYISAGDIYQVNLAQRFSAKIEGGVGARMAPCFGLFEELRVRTPSPHACYMDLWGVELLSSSPETFLKFDGKRVLTRPIKGTRPRYDDAAEDQRSAYELRTSEKEVSELVMITDLQRNDLGKVCGYGSVVVESMLKLEKYEQVYHLVSTVAGDLRAGVSQVAAVAECFPGGSITGAPKKRAMEIIDELEELKVTPRGVYTGAMGYFGFNGQSQFNIVIRTLVREGDTLHYHVGAGIVADSDAQAEYQETLQKAKGIRLAVDGYLGWSDGIVG